MDLEIVRRGATADAIHCLPEEVPQAEQKGWFMDQEKIEHLGGIVTAGGLVAGGGYGKVPLVSQQADACAAWLVERFGQPVQVRGNSHGRSAGAYRTVEGSFASEYGLSVRLLPDSEAELHYQAFFSFPLERGREVSAALSGCEVDTDPFLKAPGCGDAWSPDFEDLSQAGEWLAVWEPKFCPALVPGAEKGEAS